MPRRTKDQRKDDYLDVGAELVAETALAGGAEPGLALAHVKLADVADRAGVTKGALYHLWPSQEAFWNDLLRHLLDEQRLFGSNAIAAVADRSAADDVEPGLRGFANLLFDTARDDPTFFTRIALFSYLHDEKVRAVLDAEFRDSIDLVIPRIEVALERIGRRLHDGVTVWDFAVSVGALLEGLCLQYRIDPSRTPDLDLGDGARWSLFAAAAEGLLFAFTEPVGDRADAAGSS